MTSFKATCPERMNFFQSKKFVSIVYAEGIIWKHSNVAKVSCRSYFNFCPRVNLKITTKTTTSASQQSYRSSLSEDNSRNCVDYREACWITVCYFRALLLSRSRVSFVTEQCPHQLSFLCQKANTKISSVVAQKNYSKSASVNYKARNNSKTKLAVIALVLRKHSNFIPPSKFKVSNLPKVCESKF